MGNIFRGKSKFKNLWDRQAVPSELINCQQTFEQINMWHGIESMASWAKKQECEVREDSRKEFKYKMQRRDQESTDGSRSSRTSITDSYQGAKKNPITMGIRDWISWHIILIFKGSCEGRNRQDLNWDEGCRAEQNNPYHTYICMYFHSRNWHSL